MATSSAIGEVCEIKTTNNPRKRQRKIYRRELIKRAKVSGLPHRTHKNDKDVLARETGPNCRCKRHRCFEIITLEQRSELLNFFNNMKSKNEQDSYLSGLITVIPVQRRRSRAPIAKSNSDSEDEHQIHQGVDHIASFKYKIRLPGKEVEVCAKALRSIFGVTEMRIRRIRNSLAMTGFSPKDSRGKHQNRPRKTKPSDVEAVIAHISSFKGRQSHYTRRLDKKKIYLPSELNVRKMYNMFRDLHPASKVSYFVYYEIFRTRFNISFSYPQM